jgi:4-hydroxy-tetrahydrodipicolinate synthase
LNIDLYNASISQDADTVRQFFYKQLPLLNSTLPTPVNAELRLQGFEAGAPRSPLPPLSEDGVVELKALKQLAGSQS